MNLPSFKKKVPTIKDAPLELPPFAGFEINDSFVKIYLQNFEKKSLIQDEKDITEAIKQLLQDAAIATGVSPKESLAAISGFWTSGAMAVIRYNREESEKPIKKKEFKKISEKLSKLALTETESAVYKTYGTENIDLGLINSQQTFIKVDGFLTENIENLKGKSVEIGFLNCFAKASVLEKIENAFKQKKLNLLTITNALNAKISFPPEELLEEKDYIALFSAGSSTDIAIIFNNKVVTSKTMPLSIGFAKKNREFFFDALEEVLCRFEGIKTFPHKIVIIDNALKFEQKPDYSWAKSLPFAQEPEIIIVKKDMKSIIDNVYKSVAN